MFILSTGDIYFTWVPLFTEWIKWWKGKTFYPRHGLDNMSKVPGGFCEIVNLLFYDYDEYNITLRIKP